MKCPYCNWEFSGGSVCPRCGKEIHIPHSFCPQCGRPGDGYYCSFCGTKLKTPWEEPDRSDKNKWAAFFLCLFLGGLGIHRFYVGKVGTGILWLCLFALSRGLWTVAVLVDLIFIVMGKFRDKNGRCLK